MTTIRLGFEIRSGLEVAIPIRHTAITGQTQESGKTTTLEAMTARSSLRAVAFVTKRGEKSFKSGRAIRPYFEESADWQFVESILEATMRERMKFQRAWIMKICQANHGRDGDWKKPATLQDVASNIEIAMVKARGLNESVYRELSEYLRIVIPQIQRLPKTDKVDLKPGINVMHLTDYSEEMQALIIRSVIEWIHEHENKTVTIIPEAWKFIPQERQSPVRLACERLIREGAGIENYVWIDSQDLAGVNKAILRHVAVWILGVQREHNEAERTLDHIPGSVRKPKLNEIMTLGKGQFFVCHGDDLHKTYIWPVWLSHEQACLVAMTGMTPPARPAQTKSEDDMWQERAEAAEAKLLEQGAKIEGLVANQKRLEDQNRIQQATIRDLQKMVEGAPAGRTQPPSVPPDAKPQRTYIQPEFSGEWLAALLNALIPIIDREPRLLRLISQHPEIEVSLQARAIELSDESLKGRVALLISEGFFDNGATGYQVWQELGRRGNGSAKPNVYTACAELCSMGFLIKEQNGNATDYKRVPGLKVTTKQIST